MSSLTPEELAENLRTLRSSFPAESDKHTAARQIVDAYRLALADVDASRLSAAAARDLLTKAEMERDALRAELVALRMQMEPTQLEPTDPTTLDGALASLRLWRGGARRLHQRLTGIVERMDTVLDAPSADVVRWVVNGPPTDAERLSPKDEEPAPAEAP